MASKVKLGVREQSFLKRYDGKRFFREVSDTDEGRKGGGYRYFLESGKSIPPATACKIIKKGFAKPLGDGLFADASQSFIVEAQ